MIDGVGKTKGDEAEPRAPSQSAWNKMSPEEKERAARALPALVPVELAAPEGDAHRKTKSGAIQSLESFFRRIGRKIYVSSDLAVFYPDQQRIVPDLFVVLDVEAHERTKWIVSAEGRGLDLVLEVRLSHQKGAPAGDTHEQNMERYAALGITEYFVVDRERRRLRGYRLPRADAREYKPIAPEEGRLPSRVLGLDLMVEGSRLRFFCGTAVLPEADELIARLASMLNEAVVLKEEAERHADEEARRAGLETRRAEEAIRRAEEVRARADEETRRAEELGERGAHTERRLAEALSELHKLKGWE